MNVEDLRKLSGNELTDELKNLLKEQFNLRMMRGSGQDVKPHLIKNVRKNIARVKTILSENKIKENAKEDKS